MNRIKLLTLFFMLPLLAIANKEGRFIYVEKSNAESFLQALAQANERNADIDAERIYIILPDGTYDLGEKVLTAITGHNISIIGQGMKTTVIRNQPDAANEGIGKTGTLQNRATGLYLQDLTLQNALDYYNSGAAGRAVCLHDKGTRTICKRVRMLSYQDTYYSDNDSCQHYFEDCEIHGTIDFICGSGDVFFNHCTLVTEKRNADGTGRNVIAAPRTSQTLWGYVFSHCTVRNIMSDFHLARPWHTHPRCAWISTTLATPERLLQPRFDDHGMRTVNCEFFEYATTDLNGDVISPASNIVTFTCGDDKKTFETIIAKAKARQFQLKNVFPQWRPDKVARGLEKAASKAKRP